MKSLDRFAHRRPSFRSALIAIVTAPVMAFLLLPGITRAEALDAFPGAEGFGRSAQGGRGGRIIPVVNLDDSGPGSLRACLLETGPRNCVFRVSGVIVAKRSLIIDGAVAGQVSVLGQTAPGGGITITVAPDTDSFMRTPLIVRNTEDVVIRHLRLRSQMPPETENVDALTVENSSRVYIDHVSASWATDENFNVELQTSDLTVAYSIFGEGLRKHSKCALLGSNSAASQNITFWRNICISNNDRNPDVNHYRGSCVEITDNLFYNARSEWGEIFSQKQGGTPISFVGNYFKAGPSTLENTYAIRWNDANSVAPPSIYAEGNAVWSPPGKTLTMVADNTAPTLIDRPECPLNAPTLGGGEASYEEVRAHAGALPRDKVDRRLMREIGDIGAAGAGKIRKTPGRVEPVEAADAYVDADGDGMADSIETSIGATPATADAWEGGDDDGWYNFDRFLRYLSNERLAGRYPR